MKKTFLLFQCLSILITACNKPDTVKTYVLKPSSEIIKLQVDSTTSNVSDFLSYQYFDQTNQELLVFINSNKNEIQVFDLGAKRMAKKISVPEEGPRGTGKLQAVSFTGLDSLYLFPSTGNKLYLIDSEFRTFEALEYDPPVGYSNAITGNPFFVANPLFSGNKLFTKSLYETNFRSVSNEQLSSIHLGYGIDLKTSMVEPLPHYYPEDYFEKGMKYFQFSVSYSDNGAVYSFFGDHNLYFAKDLNTELGSKEAKSAHLGKEIPIFPAEGDALDRAEYYSTSDHYGSLLYDEYREVYYRFCFPKIELSEMNDIRSNIRNPHAFSVLILDKDLNILGESLFDNNSRYLPMNAYVGKRGLYLSLNHADNEDVDEDFMAFELMQLVGR